MTTVATRCFVVKKSAHTHPGLRDRWLRSVTKSLLSALAAAALAGDDDHDLVNTIGALHLRVVRRRHGIAL